MLPKLKTYSSSEKNWFLFRELAPEMKIMCSRIEDNSLASFLISGACSTLRKLLLVLNLLLFGAWFYESKAKEVKLDFYIEQRDNFWAGKVNVSCFCSVVEVSINLLFYFTYLLRSYLLQIMCQRTTNAM